MSIKKLKKCKLDWLGFITCVLLTMPLCAANTQAQAAHATPERYCTEANCGLKLHPATGPTVDAPILKTTVDIDISGAAVLTVVRQSFMNPSNNWVKGIYSYPLPTGAAVNQLKMIVGGRVIIGEIHERASAEKKYQQAKKSGRKASLVKANRPNLFTTKVANLGPHEEVEIEIAFFNELPMTVETQTLRFPMVIGPRYTPGAKYSADNIGDQGLATEPSPSQIDAIATLDSALPRIPTMTVGDPNHNPVKIAVNLNIGVALASINSLYHEIDIRRRHKTAYAISLVDGSIPADRDFVLEFTPEKPATPQATLLSQKKGEFHYGLLMLMPPKSSASVKLPREVTFIVDRSGSMGGMSIVQAKAALLHALKELTPEDRFNIVQFSSDSESLFTTIVDASPENLQLARSYVERLHASGGTEMLGALRRAFASKGSSEHVQQVIFITDGNVSNETSLFNLIERKLGKRRLFTIGIGSAPNQYFLKHASAAGRGTHTFIGEVGEVEKRMTSLFEKLKQPVLRDLQVVAKAPQTGPAYYDAINTIEYWPKTLPDLYAGEPIALAFRTTGAPVEIKVSGKLPDRQWHATTSLKGGQQRRGLAELWGQRKIAALMIDYRRNNSVPAKQKIAKDKVLETALSHHLVSKFTSLVAVEQKATNLTVLANKSKSIARHLPHGWRHAHSNTRLPQTGTDSWLRLVVGLFLLLILSLSVVRRRSKGAAR